MNDSKTNEITQIQVKKALRDRIDKHIMEHPELGYQTATEFVRSAIRALLESEGG